MKAMVYGELAWDPMSQQIGGFCYECADTLSRHADVQAMPVSAVGNDAHGKQLLATMQATGIPTHCIATVDDMPTGTLTAMITQEGEKVPLFNKPCAWDRIPLSRELTQITGMGDVDLLCFDIRCQRDEQSRKTLQWIFDHVAPKMGYLQIQEQDSFLSSDILIESLRHAQLVGLLQSELPFVAKQLGTSNEGLAVATALMEEYGIQQVLLLQSHGTAVLHGRSGKTVGSYNKPVACATSVAYALTTGLPPKQAMDMAMIQDHA